MSKTMVHTNVSKNKILQSFRSGEIKHGFIFVLSGPSGSGKTTLAKKLLNLPTLKQLFFKPVSFTTRPKRSKEKNEKDYIFVSSKRFEFLREEKKILESTRYLGYYYGTPAESVEQATKNGLNVILCLDIKGADFIKKTYTKKAVTIFVKPPSLSIAKERILIRAEGVESDEIDKRIEIANKELKFAEQYDFCIVNDNLKQAIKELKRIILWAIYQ